MRRRSSSQRAPRVAKRAREAAEGLTFLEKLVLRALPTRQVPAESGVRFAISTKAKNDGICLIFRVDDAEAPIVEEGPRPDYLVIHVTQSGCTMTIVEMKGAEEKNIEHGIQLVRSTRMQTGGHRAPRETPPPMLGAARANGLICAIRMIR